MLALWLEDTVLAFTGKSLALSTQGLEAAARILGVGTAEIWAVVSVETSGCGFLPDRRPQILFERHYFHRLTGGRFHDPDLSDPTPGGYGPSGAHQYDRLERALTLDRTAALRSASWGIGQVMGDNFAAAGFPDVEAMVSAMADSEDAQLAALSSFVRAAKMGDLLRARDWQAFAARYNGPGFAANHYDEKLREAFASGSPADLSVRTAQLYLTFLGANTGGIDGQPGARTGAAIRTFEATHGLPVTGKVTPALLTLLEKALD